MKYFQIFKYFFVPVFILLFLVAFNVEDKDKNKKKQKEMRITNINGKGDSLMLEFEVGKSHNNPTFAVWLEDMNENYIQTLFVTKSVATSVFEHGEKKQDTWKHEPGVVRRPATLPYFLHKRNIKAADGTYLPTPNKPIPDAYTGATPKNNFTLETKTDNKLRGKYRLLFEVNQSWDWNKYWHNNLHPDNFNYKTSCQPALVYAVTVSFDTVGVYYLNPIGHSHYAGETGELFTNLSTITTAKHIFESIKLVIK